MSLFRSLLPAKLLLGATLLAAPACKTNAPDPATTTSTTVLTGSSFIGEYSPAVLAGRVPTVPLVGALARYPVRVYRLTYRTNTTDG